MFVNRLRAFEENNVSSKVMAHSCARRPALRGSRREMNSTHRRLNYIRSSLPPRTAPTPRRGTGRECGRNISVKNLFEKEFHRFRSSIRCLSELCTQESLPEFVRTECHFSYVQRVAEYCSTRPNATTSPGRCSGGGREWLLMSLCVSHRNSYVNGDGVCEGLNAVQRENYSRTKDIKFQPLHPFLML